MYLDMGSILTRTAARRADRTFLITRNERLSYGEVRDRAETFGLGLLDRGFVPGDRLTITMRNRPEYVVALFGAALVGVTPVPVNRRYGWGDIRHVVADTGSKAVLVDSGSPHLGAAAEDGLGVRWIVVGADPVGLANAESFDRVRPARGGRALPDLVRDDETEGAIHYTSGTTARPKGVVRSHLSNAAMALGANAACGFTADDVWSLMLPMHSSGIYGFVLGAVLNGAPCVLADFDAASLGETVEAERTTMLSMGPTMYQSAAASLRRHDLSSVRTALAGGMPISPAIARAMSEILPVPMLGSYGMTEATMITFSTPEVHASGRVTSNGFPTALTAVRVVDDAGADVPAGGEGEVLLRGAVSFTEYLGLPERTAGTLRDGWVWTGDRGRLDPDGALTVSGRNSDMIISGNENVFPPEVEDTIAQLPGVEQVAVVGVDSIEWGQEVRAFVVRSDQAVDEERVKDYCRLHLARYKVPKRVRFLDDLPKDPIGKIQRRALAEEG
jgi:acyl-CoA synthetase (AMP-forming)/AMP-acid ligase II